MPMRLSAAVLLVLAVPACGDDGPFTGRHQLERTLVSSSSCPADLSEMPTVITLTFEHTGTTVYVASDLGAAYAEEPSGTPPELHFEISGGDDWPGAVSYDLLEEDGAITGDEVMYYSWPEKNPTSSCDVSWTLAPVPSAN